MNLDQLGPYRIGRKLGRGGMGTVYEGLDTGGGGSVAVKVLSASLADEEGFRDRFETEIKTLKQLNHPNIVRLVGWGAEQGQLYYAMELVDGLTLEEELQAGRRFDWREVTHFGIKLCKALRHAHDRGVIHRDIKPANLLLTADGELKLSDFGIARLYGNTRLTAEGGLIGTAEYMAPEQADGRIVTYQCDLYSLGCVLFALLAGRPPFQSRSLPEMLQMQRFAEPPPLSRFAPDVPEELEQIIHRLLAKDPQQRAANATVLGRQLAATEYGLSLFARDEAAPSDETRAIGAPEDEVLPGSPGDVLHDPLAMTREIAPSSSDAPTDAGNRTVQRSPQETAARAKAAQDFVPRQPTLPPASRFTTLEEDAAAQSSVSKRSEGLSLILQSAMLLAVLAAIVIGAYSFFRPLSADRLFTRIQAAGGEDHPERWLDVEDDINAFLTRFPDDPRSEQISSYKERITQVRLERRLQRQAKQLVRDASIPAVQRDYLEAIAWADLDRPRAIKQLQAVIAFYSDPLGNDETVQNTLEVAARELKRLQTQTDAAASEQRKTLLARLARADELAEKDLPKARQIWQAVVQLYGDKAWAADEVSAARRRLESRQLPLATPSIPAN